MTTYPRVKMKARDLQLADEVKSELGTEGWDTAIVSQIRDGNIHLFRPYGTHADFSYTGGVICYIGVANYTIAQDSDVEYYVYKRTSLR
jgi:hypothetical protein